VSNPDEAQSGITAEVLGDDAADAAKSNQSKFHFAALLARKSLNWN
jgi:hypothetical protein